jgi:hypothetical protein
MVTTSEGTQARPLFRKLALGMAFVCFLLGLIFGFAPVPNRMFTVGACLFVGFVMLTIAQTGYWPPRRAGR